MSSIAIADAYEWEREPRPGELPLNQIHFKAAHNSYERSEPNVSQIDDYNCWALEWDLCWNDPTGTIRVTHEPSDWFGPDGCNPVTLECPGRELVDHFLDLQDCETCSERVTVMWLEFGEGNCEQCPCPYDEIRAAIESAIDLTLDIDRIYTPAEFVEFDDAHWPSWQELVRRGKNFVIILQRMSRGGVPSVFGSSWEKPTAPGPGSLGPTYVAWTYYYEDHDSLSREIKQDFWITRPWPDYACDMCCEFFCPDELCEDLVEWLEAYVDNPTLWPTNCIDDEDRTVDIRTHPPQPCCVARAGSGSPQFGTLGFPFYETERALPTEGFMGALRRIKLYRSNTDMWIEGGEYDLANGGPLTIDTPVVLKKWPGTTGAVVIR